MKRYTLRITPVVRFVAWIMLGLFLVLLALHLMFSQQWNDPLGGAACLMAIALLPVGFLYSQSGPIARRSLKVSFFTMQLLALLIFVSMIQYQMTGTFFLFEQAPWLIVILLAIVVAPLLCLSIRGWFNLIRTRNHFETTDAPRASNPP